MPSKPNIVFVLADQLGARWLPLHGHPLVSAPQLDSFARESAVFDRAITTSPVCTPYRGCLLSGLYPTQTGVLENGQAYPAGLPSIADRLNELGYATHYIGKWHLSGAPQANHWVPPARRAGFQNFIGWESHHVDHHAGLIWRDDPDCAAVMPGHETDALTDIALEQLRDCAQEDDPFFLMISYQAPHPPCSPPPKYLAPYEDQDLPLEPNADASAWFKHEAWKADYDVQRFRQLYFGEISQLGAAFGRLLGELEALELRDNTVVVFTSDHGEMAGAHGRFGKGLMYEEALHVPLVIRGPGQSSGGRSKGPAATVDLAPTLLDYAGGDVDAAGDGMSLRAQVEGDAIESERIVFSEYRNFCATTDRWKLFTRGRNLEMAGLYNIADDPYELRNHVDDPACAEIQSRLTEELVRWRERVSGADMRPESA